MTQILLGKTCKLYTKKGWFYKGEVVEETETHVIIHDFKTDKDVMFSREWISELRVTDEGDGGK